VRRRPPLAPPPGGLDAASRGFDTTVTAPGPEVEGGLDTLLATAAGGLITPVAAPEELGAAAAPGLDSLLAAARGLITPVAAPEELGAAAAPSLGSEGGLGPP